MDKKDEDDDNDDDDVVVAASMQDDPKLQGTLKEKGQSAKKFAKGHNGLSSSKSRSQFECMLSEPTRKWKWQRGETNRKR